jgi:O-acetylserine/cysteine efflux transporter
MSRRDTALALVVVTLWGANFVAIDEGLRSMPPLLFLAIRFVFVAFPAILIVPRPAVPWRRLIAIGATTSLVQFTFLYLALGLGMPPGLASLVLQAQVVFTIVLAAVVLGERVAPRGALGLVIALAGLVTIIASRWSGAGWLPVLVTVAGAASWAAGNVFTRATGAPSGLGIVVWTAPVVPVPALLLSLAIDGPGVIGHSLAAITPTAVASTAFTVVFSSLIGYGLWNGLLARNPAARVTPFALLIPVVGMATAWLAFGQAPTLGDASGGAVMIAGLAVATVRTRRAPAVARPEGGESVEVARRAQDLLAHPPLPARERRTRDDRRGHRREVRHRPAEADRAGGEQCPVRPRPAVGHPDAPRIDHEPTVDEPGERHVGVPADDRRDLVG